MRVKDCNRNSKTFIVERSIGSRLNHATKASRKKTHIHSHHTHYNTALFHFGANWPFKIVVRAVSKSLFVRWAAEDIFLSWSAYWDQTAVYASSVFCCKGHQMSCLFIRQKNVHSQMLPCSDAIRITHSITLDYCSSSVSDDPVMCASVYVILQGNR